MPGTVLSCGMFNYINMLLVFKELKGEGNYRKSNQMFLKAIILNLFDHWIRELWQGAEQKARFFRQSLMFHR